MENKVGFKYADEIIDLMESSGTGKEKINQWKKYIVEHFKKTKKRISAKEFLPYLEGYLNIPKYEKETSPNYVTYKKFIDLMNHGEILTIQTKDEYQEYLESIKQEKE